MKEYEELTAAIAKALPEIEEMGGYEDGDENRPITHIRPITLEDVLRANYGNPLELSIDDGGWVWTRPLNDWESNGDIRWNLGKPLSEQSPETLNFLHKLLCK